MGCKGSFFQGCNWPSYGAKHSEETSSPNRAARQSIVQEVWSERGNIGLNFSECEVLASPRHAYLGSFFETEDIKSLGVGANWIFSKVPGIQ